MYACMYVCIYIYIYIYKDFTNAYTDIASVHRLVHVCPYTAAMYRPQPGKP